MVDKKPRERAPRGPRKPSTPLARRPNRIAYWRIKRGLTGEKLAELAEMSPSNVSQLENGRQDLTGSAAKKLAKALGVSVPDLFKVGDESEPAEPDDAIHEINDIIRTLAPSDLKRVADIVRAFRRQDGE